MVRVASQVYKFGEQVTSFLGAAKKQRKSIESFSVLATHDQAPEALISEVIAARQIKETYAPLINSISRSDAMKTKFKRRFSAGFETVLLNLDKVIKLHNELTTATPRLNHNPKYSMEHLRQLKTELSQFVASATIKLSSLDWFADKVHGWINVGAHIGRRSKGWFFTKETKDLLLVALNCRHVLALAAGATPKLKHSTTTVVPVAKRH